MLNTALPHCSPPCRLYQPTHYSHRMIQPLSSTYMLLLSLTTSLSYLMVTQHTACHSQTTTSKMHSTMVWATTRLPLSLTRSHLLTQMNMTSLSSTRATLLMISCYGTSSSSLNVYSQYTFTKLDLLCLSSSFTSNLMQSSIRIPLDGLTIKSLKSCVSDLKNLSS